MQWNGANSPTPPQRAPLRSLMEILQEKAEPYVTRYGENYLQGSGPLFNSIVRSGVEMSPGAGDLLGVEDLQTAAQNNDWGGIGLGLLAAIPGIPAIRGARGEVRAARRAGGLLEPSRPGLLGDTAPSYRVERSQDLAPTDTPESLRAQGYEIDPATNTWARTVATEAPPVDYPIRAFHGSPHSFDQFSLDKIGTGEGAQAYGHGLYFAESEDVARSYRDRLSTFDAYGSRKPNIATVDGVPARDIDQDVWEVADQIASRGFSGVDELIADLQSRLATSSNPERAVVFSDLLSQAESIAPQIRGKNVQFDQGSMYEVGINAHPDTFLDWDRPLSEQPAIAERLGVDPSANARQAAEIRAAVADDMRMSGRTEPDSIDLDRIRLAEEMDALDASGNASSYAPRSQQMIDELLAKGINGIRYLDGNSRGVGEGSSNYVLFNDELVKILRKYGVSGLGFGVGGTALADELDRRGQAQEF